MRAICHINLILKFQVSNKLDCATTVNENKQRTVLPLVLYRAKKHARYLGRHYSPKDFNFICDTSMNDSGIIADERLSTSGWMRVMK